MIVLGEGLNGYVDIASDRSPQSQMLNEKHNSQRLGRLLVTSSRLSAGSQRFGCNMKDSARHMSHSWSCFRKRTRSGSSR